MASFRILGPIEAWSGERRLPLGGQRQLGLLAFLLLRGNRAASSDALLDAVWGSDRPGADNRLQMGIARLRKALAPLQSDGEAILRTVGGGYLLSVAPGELDTDVFETSMKQARTALDSGQHALAAELSSAALELWRGPPLAEVAFASFAQGEIRRLDELRLAAVETRIDAELQLGRHHELVGELDALSIEHPGRERIAGQLMLAEYRCGRQSEALEVYQRTRAYLARELGLEPGPALRALQAQILEHAPELNGGAGPDVGQIVGAPAHARRRLEAPLPTRLAPYGPTRFVDRRAERDALERALGEAAADGRRAAFVTGEPGIGKTRLVSEVAAAAHRRGALVLAGRCDNTLNLPYQPFVEALEHLVEHAPEQLLADHVFECGDSVARLVPALASRLGRPPATAHESSESERYVLFRAIERLLGAACAEGPVVLVLEDLHWAELPTLKLLRRLLTSPRSQSLMVLATCRVVDLSDDHPLRDLLVDLHREPHVLRMDLRGLETADVAELIRGISEQPLETADDRLVRALEAGTNGNPFFITELVRSMVESGTVVTADGRWQLTDGADVGAQLPVSIAETFAGRVRRMGEPVQRCLRAAAVLGAEFDFDLLSEVIDDPAAADALDEAVSDAVLIEVPGDPPHFRFSHALMQRYLYRELGAARRMALHGRVALALRRRAQSGRSPAAAVARHLIAAGDSGLPDALTYAARAGDEALEKLAPDEARRWYQVSLELLTRIRASEDARECGLLVKRGEAERQAGDQRFRETLLGAAAIALRIGDESGLVRAALANTRGMQSEDRGRRSRADRDAGRGPADRRARGRHGPRAAVGDAGGRAHVLGRVGASRVAQRRGARDGAAARRPRRADHRAQHAVRHSARARDARRAQRQHGRRRRRGRAPGGSDGSVLRLSLAVVCLHRGGGHRRRQIVGRARARARRSVPPTDHSMAGRRRRGEPRDRGGRARDRRRARGRRAGDRAPERAGCARLLRRPADVDRIRAGAVRGADRAARAGDRREPRRPRLPGHTRARAHPGRAPPRGARAPRRSRRVELPTSCPTTSRGWPWSASMRT